MGQHWVELNINYHAGWKEAANEFEKFYGLVIGPAAESRPAVYLERLPRAREIALNYKLFRQEH